MTSTIQLDNPIPGSLAKTFFSYAEGEHTSEIGDPIDVIVDNQYRDNVGYIVAELWDENAGVSYRQPIGTVFIVSCRFKEVITHYAVTCSHVVNPDESGKSAPLFIRLNKTDGKYTEIPAPSHRWIHSQSSDIAVSKINLDRSLRYWAYPIEEIVRVADIRPGIGDDVFIAGLFSSDPGEDSVEVLVRSGRISRVASPVNFNVNLHTGETKKADAYLIESFAWGGESGSPVFVYRPKFSVD